MIIRIKDCPLFCFSASTTQHYGGQSAALWIFGRMRAGHGFVVIITIVIVIFLVIINNINDNNNNNNQHILLSTISST